MSADHNAEGQVIKRLSFGDMSSHQLLHGEEATYQRHDLGHGDRLDPDAENDENIFEEAQRGPAAHSKSLRDKQADYHRALEEIRPTSSRFNALEEAARAEYKETGPGKLASLKDQFSKSKFEYVELETKEHFVRAIAEEGDRVLAGEEVKGSFLLEGVVGNQKAKVQELKRQKEQTGLAINNIIDQIAAEMSELEKEQHVVGAELEACEEALQTWERTQEALAAAQSGENNEDLEELHSQQEGQLHRLAEQEASAQQAGLQNKQDADRLADEIVALQAKLQEAQAESLRLQQAAEQVGRVSRSTEVYEEMLELLHDLAGISLTSSTDRQLVFRMTTHITATSSRTGKPKHVPVEHDLVVALHPDTAEIEDAMLSPADVDISDIMAIVRGTQRLDALVRELRQRMSCYAVRKDQVARATRATKYKMRVEDTTMIQVALPATNVIAMVDAPYDWPSTGVPLRLASLLSRKGDSAFQDEVAEMVLGQINKSVAAQEGDLISLVQSIELELRNLELS